MISISPEYQKRLGLAASKWFSERGVSVLVAYALSGDHLETSFTLCLRNDADHLITIYGHRPFRTCVLETLLGGDALGLGRIKDMARKLLAEHGDMPRNQNVLINNVRHCLTSWADLGILVYSNYSYKLNENSAVDATDVLNRESATKRLRAIREGQAYEALGLTLQKQVSGV